MTSAPILLHNSLTRETEAFQPIEAGCVRMYSCGPTVYHYAHLGNLRAYVFTDTLRRMLEWKGLDVTHVINITDVGHLTSDADEGEDKMELAARRVGTDIWQVAAFYTAAFKADIADLGIQEPSTWSVATDHIQPMIDFIKTIEATGAAYLLPSGLYLDTSLFPDHTLLSGSVRDSTTEGRIEVVEGKRHPHDFALWRTSSPGENRQMEWNSPWGRGSPGWHIECSAMSMGHLGNQFDIHTGGIDHREIHHCNEIVQNQAFTGTRHTGANYWLHNNFLVDRAGKMSKSSGEFATLSSVVEKGIHPLAYRLMCLSAHYRSELEFSPENLKAAFVRLKRLVMAISPKKALVDGVPTGGRSELERNLSEAARAFLNRFDEAIAADLMIPRALPLIDEVLASRDLDAYEMLAVIGSMDLVFGLQLLTLNREDLRLRPADAKLTEADIEIALDQRAAARKERDFATSDRLRDQLTAAGVEIMDGDALRWDWKIDFQTANSKDDHA